MGPSLLHKYITIHMLKEQANRTHRGEMQILVMTPPILISDPIVLLLHAASTV